MNAENKFLVMPRSSPPAPLAQCTSTNPGANATLCRMPAARIRCPSVISSSTTNRWGSHPPISFSASRRTRLNAPTPTTSLFAFGSSTFHRREYLEKSQHDPLATRPHLHRRHHHQVVSLRVLRIHQRTAQNRRRKQHIRVGEKQIIGVAILRRDH